MDIRKGGEGVKGPRPDEMTRVATYAGVRAVLRRPDVIQVAHNARESAPIIGGSLLTLAGAEHLERRSLESRLFKGQALEWWEMEAVLPALRRALTHSVGTARDVEADLLPFTRLVMLRLSAALIGLLPIDDVAAADCLREQAEKLQEALAVEFSLGDHDELIARALRTLQEFRERYYAPAVANRTRQGSHDPRAPGDLLSILLTAPEPLSDEQIFRETVLYLVASSGTTSNATPHAVADLERWLADNPEARPRLSSFAFCRDVAQEALRLHPPVPALLRRLTTPMTTPDGQKLSAGEYAYLDIATAGQDPAAFGPSAERFDPERTVPEGVDRYGFAFGGGPHICIGRNLVVGHPTVEERDDKPQGVLTRIIHEMYRWNLRPSTAKQPVKRPETETEVYQSFPVVLGCPLHGAAQA